MALQTFFYSLSLSLSLLHSLFPFPLSLFFYIPVIMNVNNGGTLLHYSVQWRADHTGRYYRVHTSTFAVPLCYWLSWSIASEGPPPSFLTMNRKKWKTVEPCSTTRLDILVIPSPSRSHTGTMFFLHLGNRARASRWWFNGAWGRGEGREIIAITRRNDADCYGVRFFSTAVCNWDGVVNCEWMDFFFFLKIFLQQYRVEFRSWNLEFVVRRWQDIAIKF